MERHVGLFFRSFFFHKVYRAFSPFPRLCVKGSGLFPPDFMLILFNRDHNMLTPSIPRCLRLSFFPDKENVAGFSLMGRADYPKEIWRDYLFLAREGTRVSSLAEYLVFWSGPSSSLFLAHSKK